MIGGAWLLAVLGIARLPVEAVVGLALIVLGASIVITGRTDWSLSRRGWPLWAGAALLLIAFVTSNATSFGQPQLRLHAGNSSFTATSWDSLPTKVTGGAGNVTIDLSHLKGAPPHAETLDVASAFGNIHVLLPPDADVAFQGRVVAGQVCDNGATLGSGGGVVVSNQVIQQKPGPVLTLDVKEVFGQVDIGTGCRVSPVPTPPTPPATVGSTQIPAAPTPAGQSLTLGGRG